ncbi:MAG: helix-turn-helix transcriptional regulator [Colwellia sp.]
MKQNLEKTTIQPSLHTQQLARWLTEKQAAEHLNVSPPFLAKNRCYAPPDKVIPYVKLGKRCIRYDRVQLEKWLEDQIKSFEQEAAL